jgi:hypothetical protein
MLGVQLYELGNSLAQYTNMSLGQIVQNDNGPNSLGEWLRDCVFGVAF